MAKKYKFCEAENLMCGPESNSNFLSHFPFNFAWYKKNMTQKKIYLLFYNNNHLLISSQTKHFMNDETCKWTVFVVIIYLNFYTTIKMSGHDMILYTYIFTRKRYDDVDDHHMCQNFILLSVIIIISSWWCSINLLYTICFDFVKTLRIPCV